MSLSIYILAGGKSSRMGEDKGLILFRDKALIQHVIDIAMLVTENIVIVCSNKRYEIFGIPLVHDIEKNLGPAGAIDTMLHHSTTEKNLVLACDMPFIDETSLKFLVRQSEVAQITLPLYHQYPEALMAVYHTSCKLKWHELVQSGILKLSDLLSNFETNFVDGNQMSEFNKKLFKNMNSKEDLLDL